MRGAVIESKLTEVWRVVDANANRAAEGLRTLEDFARLIREDQLACQLIKALRHRLASILAGMGRSDRLRSRDSEHDAGTQVSAEGEISRNHVTDIVTSASERVTQSLRQLEEYSKLLSREWSAEFKQLRYAAYDALARVELRLEKDRSTWFQAPSLYLLIDCDRPIDDLAQYVAALAGCGVDWFQLRDKSVEATKLVDYGRAIQQALAGTEARFIVNDRIDVALACEADGVHLGQEDLPLQDARQIVGDSMVVGISTHDLSQARDAEQGGADYIGCGPTFPSATKGFEQFAGPEFLRQVAKEIQIPAYAIGGIALDNIDQVVGAGFRRIAASAAVHAQADPLVAARSLKQQLAT